MYIYQTMSGTFGYIDIILLAMIAGFIILRLRSILGRKTGHEEKIYTDFSDKNYQKFREQQVDSKINKQESLEGENKKQFLQGAEIAYETIITAFAKGDRIKLKSLLSDQMFRNFNEAITQREKNGIVSELTFIGIKNSQLENTRKLKISYLQPLKLFLK